MMLQDIDHGIVRYSQRSIEATFMDRRTPVETWMNNLPYTFPLVVALLQDGQFLSLDNRRLYSAKNYSLNRTVQCFVHQLDEPPADLLMDYGFDILEVLCVDNKGLLNRLTVRANTIEGVMMIRCVTQDSTFPTHGRLERPQPGSRHYDAETWKIAPPNLQFAATNDDYMESLQASDRILVCVKRSINVYHERNDLRQIMVDRPELFQMLRNERSTVQFTLISSGKKKSDSWDNWDELLAVLAEAESNVQDEYELAFFESMKVFCEVVEYDVPDYSRFPEKVRRQQELDLVVKDKSELLTITKESVNAKHPMISLYSVEVKAGDLFCDQIS
jgi:hypothetical protein